ncbi:MAG TPA: hypothetical protein VHE32_06350 [Rhodanobacteraceae bacterium]|jgi:hypothetical protein|nr:hypothetical protein [Rhodanobacteraceae bacterium]
MVTPVSVAGATARALAPFVVDVAVETAEGLLVLTDFPDCFSIVLDFAVCFDAATAFFVAGAGFAGFAGLADFAGFDEAGFDGIDFGAGFIAVFATGLAALPALFFATAGRLELPAAFGAGLCALPAALFARAAGFAFFAPADAGFFVAIACVHLVSAAACYSPSPTLRQPPKSPRGARLRERGTAAISAPARYRRPARDAY